METLKSNEVINVYELSKIIGYTPKSIRTILSKTPERLPPKIKPLSKLRWHREIVNEWLKNSSVTKKSGRPRNPHPVF